MSSDVAFRANIPSVPPDISRPIWSVMIPSYNCTGYLAETLRSVLAQDQGTNHMQIEVVDDHSTLDDPESLVATLAQGRVGFYRQSHNVGLVKNFETCLKRSYGRYIHLLHGDDCVRPGFYAKMQRAFDENPSIGAAFCRQIFIDADGHWLGLSDLEQHESAILDNWAQRLATEQRIMTPSIVVKRDVYETLGGFDERLICAEDWEMWVRIAARYPIWYEVEPLAIYRMHKHSNTGRHVDTAEDMRYTRLAIELFKHYLPDDQRESITRSARETYALSAIESARLLFAAREAGTIAQLREAVHLSRSPKVLRALVKFVLECIPIALHKN